MACVAFCGNCGSHLASCAARNLSCCSTAMSKGARHRNHMPDIFDIMHDMDALAAIFLISNLQIQRFQRWSVNHQPYLIKLLGVLYRGQAAYVLFPMVQDVHTLNSMDGATSWAWKAWTTIRIAIHQLEHMVIPNDLTPVAALPWCWKCFDSTKRTCSQCQNACSHLGLRPIPICQRCEQCSACDFDEGDSIFRDWVQDQQQHQVFRTRRFSFHLTMQQEQIAAIYKPES